MLVSDDMIVEDGCDILKKRQDTLEKRVKVFYQDLLKLVDKVNHISEQPLNETALTTSADQSLKEEPE